MNQKEITVWKNKLAVANHVFQDLQEQQIQKYRNYYKGKQKQYIKGIDDVTVVNMIFTNVSTILPSIIFRNPKIYVSPRKKPTPVNNTVIAAQLLEVILNYYYKYLKIKRETRKCILDALIGPWGIMKIGYTSEIEKIKKNKTLIINELIKKDEPFCMRVSPMDFRVDPTAKDSYLNDAEWVAFRWVRTIDDLTNSDFSGVSKLKPNYNEKDAVYKQINKAVSLNNIPEKIDETSLWDRVEGWDVWDKKTHQLISFVPDQDIILKKSPWPLDYEGFPVEILYFNEIPDELYPLSDIETYINEQDELNKIRSLQLEHIKKIAPFKGIMKENAFESDEIMKLLYGGTAYIATTPLNPAEVFAPLNMRPMSQDLYLLSRQLKNDIFERAATADFERGVASKFDTATEASLIAQGISVLRDYRQSIVEEFTVNIITKLAGVLQQTFKKQEIKLSKDQFDQLQVSMPEKLEKWLGGQGVVLLPWITASKDDIKGDFDYEIEIGSMQPVNKETRKRDVVTLYQLLQNNPYVDIFEATKKIFEIFEIPDYEKIIKSREQVQQEQAQAQETALRSEIEKDMPKRQADLEKTKLKSLTKLEETKMKGQTQIQSSLLNMLKGG